MHVSKDTQVIVVVTCTRDYRHVVLPDGDVCAGDKGDTGEPGEKGMRGLIGFPGVKGELCRCVVSRCLWFYLDDAFDVVLSRWAC